MGEKPPDHALLGRTQESSAPSHHCTRKSRVPFSHGRSSSSAAGVTSSNRQSATARQTCLTLTYNHRT